MKTRHQTEAQRWASELNFYIFISRGISSLVTILPLSDKDIHVVQQKMELVPFIVDELRGRKRT